MTEQTVEQVTEEVAEAAAIVASNTEAVAETAERLTQLAAETRLATEQVKGGRPGLPVEHRAAQVAEVDFEQRVITFIAVPWDEEAVVPGPTGEPMRERFERGAFDGIETRSPDNPVTINRDHDPQRVVGKAIAFNTTDARGLVVDAHISRTPLGDETLRLADDRVLRASIGFATRRSDAPIRNGLRSVRRAFLDHIGMLPNPAYAGASVLAVRDEQPVERPTTPNLDAVLEMLGDDWPA